jgi:hypothetical protein
VSGARGISAAQRFKRERGEVEKKFWLVGPRDAQITRQQPQQEHSPSPKVYRQTDIFWCHILVQEKSVKILKLLVFQSCLFMSARQPISDIGA